MEQIVESITEYGLNTVIIAFLINAVTAIFKIPIKILAKKLDDYTKVTRFIVFLPIKRVKNLVVKGKTNRNILSLYI